MSDDDEPRPRTEALESELRESRDRFLDLYDFAPVPFVTLDREGVLREVNMTAARFLRSTRARMLGLPFWSWVRPEQRAAFREHLWSCRSADGLVTTELEMQSSEREPLGPIELHSQPFAPRGQVIEFRSALVSVAERKAARDEHERASIRARSHALQAESKRRFLAMLSHELRTPLTPILAAVCDLEDREELSGEIRAILRLVRRNVEQEARLIDDLLDATRIDQGKLRIEAGPLDVHELLRELVSAFEGPARTQGVRLTARLWAKQHVVAGEAGRLRQLFSNLLSNALRFTSLGDIVCVATENRGSRLCIRVIDNGEGMTEATLGGLFCPFELALARPSGTGSGLGLGLAICRGLVEAHAGSIEATSPGRGQGSTFEVVLPAITVAPEVIHVAPQARAEVEIADATILLVEDHDDTADLMAALLESAGYRVRVARDVGSALAAMDDHVDLVLSDIALPDGSGRDLIIALRRVSNVPAVALSGFGTAEDIQAARDVGFDDYLVKPVSIGRLLRAIARVRESAVGGGGPQGPEAASSSPSG